MLEKKDVDHDTIDVVKVMYKYKKNIRTNKEESKEFETKTGVTQGCVQSSLLYYVVIVEAMKEAKKTMKTLKLGYWKMQKIQFYVYGCKVIATDFEINLQHN